MKRLQNRIAQSRSALPVTAVYALAVWLVLCTSCGRSYAELALFAVAAYLMVELNNRNSLIRIYSRMVSCTYLVLTTMTASLSNPHVLLVSTCFIAAYLILFSAYQDKLAQGRMFYAFMFIGIASLVFRQALFFVPVLWLLTATNLMAFSGRNFWASLIGLTLPYWLIGGYSVITGNTGTIMSYLDIRINPISPEAYLRLSTSELCLPLALILTAAVTGIVHFLRNSYKDKIRTRMIYEMLITMTVFTTALIALQPQEADMLTGILTIHASVLAAHFIALTDTRATNAAFCLMLALALAVTALNMLQSQP